MFCRCIGSPWRGTWLLTLLIYSCVCFIWPEANTRCKKAFRMFSFYQCAALSSCCKLSDFPPFLSCPCHSSLSFLLPSPWFMCVSLCVHVCARVVSFWVCVCVCLCFLLPAPLRKAKFVESPRIPQSELGSPTHTSTTAKNPDLDTYCPGKFWPAHP